MVQRKTKGTNKWEFDISNGFDPITHERKRIIRRGFNTKKEASEAENLFRISNTNTAVSSKDVTFDMIYAAMKKRDIDKKRKDSYIKTQEYNYNKHFKQYFEKATISKLTLEEMLNFRNNLESKGLSRNTVNKQMFLLKKIMSIAVEKRYIATNPCNDVENLKFDKPEREFWTLTEFQEFIELFEDSEEAYKLIFLVAFFTGMRIGEILALTWKDVYLEDGFIKVSKTLVRGTKFITSPPKTEESKRRISIHTDLITDLKGWKSKQEQDLTPYVINTEDLQIFQFTPSFINYDNVLRKYNIVMKRNNTLKRIKIHGLRHSHVALLIYNKEEDLSIKKRLGHSTIQTTLDYYGHLYPDKEKEVSNKFNGLF